MQVSLPLRLKHGEGDHQVSVPNVSRISGSMKKLSLIDDMERNIARNAAPQVGLSDPSMQVCARIDLVPYFRASALMRE